MEGSPLRDSDPLGLLIGGTLAGAMRGVTLEQATEIAVIGNNAMIGSGVAGGMIAGAYIVGGTRGVGGVCIAVAKQTDCKKVARYGAEAYLACVLATGIGHGGNPRNENFDPSRHRQRDKLEEAGGGRRQDEKPPKRFPKPR